MRLVRLACIFAPLLACSEVLVVPGDGDGSGGAPDGAAAVGSTTNSTATTATATATSAAGGAGQGGASFEGCPVDPDNGFSIEVYGPSFAIYTVGCGTEEQPLARYSPGGECAPGLSFQACERSANLDVSLFAPDIGAGSGSYSTAEGSYVLSDMAFNFIVVGDVGEDVRATFSGNALGPDGTTIPMDGWVHVCRGPDLPPCP